jgi:tetratricopeptide (TPR) repeat protein
MNFCFLIISFFSLQSIAQPSAQESLAQSQSYFNQGKYTKALQAIANLDVRKDLDSSEDMLDALKIRTIAYTESNLLEQAREVIRELLFINPDYKFDPFDTPKRVVELAEHESKIIWEKNQQLALLKNQKPNLIETPDYININNIKSKPSFYTTFLPFGINHFSLGSSLKGNIYLSIQAASLITNIGAFWWKQSYLEKTFYPRLASQDDKKKFQTAQITQYVALSTLLTTLAVSIIDAMIGFSKGT